MKMTRLSNLGLIFILTFLISCTSLKAAKTDTVKIKTSAICGMCKDRIENALLFSKGIVNANLDLETKVVTVVYKTKKTNPDDIRQAISETGYDADTVEANVEAHDSLPACCQKSAAPH